MKINDIAIKLYALSKLENDNQNTKMGQILLDMLKEEGKKTSLSLWVAVFGLVLSIFLFFKDFNLNYLYFILLLFIMLIILISYLENLKRRDIIIGGKIISTLQRRGINGNIIKEYLENIDKDWDIEWEGIDKDLEWEHPFENPHPIIKKINKKK